MDGDNEPLADGLAEADPDELWDTPGDMLEDGEPDELGDILGDGVFDTYADAVPDGLCEIRAVAEGLLVSLEDVDEVFVAGRLLEAVLIAVIVAVDDADFVTLPDVEGVNVTRMERLDVDDVVEDADTRPLLVIDGDALEERDAREDAESVRDGRVDGVAVVVSE